MPPSAPSPFALPSAVLFDLDDTLFDHALTCRAAIARVRRDRPALRAVPLDTLWRYYLDSFAWSHRDLLQGHLTPVGARNARWRSLLQKFGADDRPRAVRAVSAEYRREYLARERPIPGATALLRGVHDRTSVVIVSNHERKEQERKLRVLGLDPWIDHLVVSKEVGVGKPDPAIFAVALDRAGVGPADAVMVGDSWDQDIVGAAAAGIRPIWFNRFGRPRPASPEATELRSLRPVRAVERVLAGGRRGRAARIISRGPVERR